LEHQIASDERKIKKIDVKDVTNEDELREKIWKLKSDTKQRERVQNSLSGIEKTIEQYTKELSEISKELASFSNEDYEKKLNEVSEHIKLHKDRKDSIEKFFEKLAVWKQNDKEVCEYKNLLRSVDELKEKEATDRKKYASACLFREKILEAESIYISNLITNINTHVQLYLDHFFPDDPISARISSFKENGKNESKPCINLEIDYKGMEHELTMLSGGELSRLILSFTLAFADIYNSPLILLDECTASLDQDLTTSVIDGLKENFGDKLVILIAHQVVQGSFDRVIKL
jgi:DNA repair exonuclease SbcCD ATPase subunit